MIPKSLRWRLPISYAGIALITTLALGFVLVATLRSYYGERELDYLQGNARAIGELFVRNKARGLADNPLVDGLVMGFSFFSQTRVQLLDADQQLLVDSGVPSGNDNFTVQFNEAVAYAQDIELRPGPRLFDWVMFFSRAEKLVEPAGIAVEVTNCENSLEPCKRSLGTDETPMPEGGVNGPGDKMFAMSLAPQLYGFGLDGRGHDDTRRSDQSLEVPIMDSAQNLIGYVHLSDGPAYGLEIVDSVAQGWLIASSIAIALAAGVGWFISQRTSVPLTALTRVTARMANGELSARAEAAREDEIGVLARTFNEMANKIEETIVVLRRFVADAAHEIHTPLTALRTNLELLNGDASNALFVRRALDQAKRLELLTDSLLQLSRIESETVREQREMVDLITLVREVNEFYASRADQAGLSFELDLPATGVKVSLYPVQFRSALGNLIDNAIKFTPENGTIKLGVQQTREHIEVVVQDSGIGIPADDLPYVFERFHRGRNAVNYDGSGLGLAIVKVLMERQKGKIRVESGSWGTRFALQLSAIGS
jgi:signal transduction histidine kinase